MYKSIHINFRIISKYIKKNVPFKLIIIYLVTKIKNIIYKSYNKKYLNDVDIIIFLLSISFVDKMLLIKYSILFFSIIVLLGFIKKPLYLFLTISLHPLTFVVIIAFPK